MLIAVALITLAGTALLCVSLPRHHWLIMRQPLEKRRAYRLRIAGYLLLLIAAVIASSSKGVGYGLTAFAGVFTVAMLACTFTVTWLNTRS
jgi:hypothetical protein